MMHYLLLASIFMAKSIVCPVGFHCLSDDEYKKITTFVCPSDMKCFLTEDYNHLMGTLECPPDMHCFAEGTYNQIMTILKSYACLQNQQPKIVMGDWVVILDKDGHLYSGDGYTDSIPGTINWCSFFIDLKFKPKLTLYSPPVEGEYGFRFRPKAYILGRAIYIMEPKNILDAGIAIDFLYYKSFNFQPIIGVFSSGLAVGYDVTPNFGAVAGAVCNYVPFGYSPIVGIYFGF